MDRRRARTSGLTLGLGIALALGGCVADGSKPPPVQTRGSATRAVGSSGSTDARQPRASDDVPEEPDDANLCSALGRCCDALSVDDGAMIDECRAIVFARDADQCARALDGYRSGYGTDDESPARGFCS